jgi:protein-tyrosine phosphatase
MSNASNSPPRILPLTTGHNFRDIGGYPAHDGKKVRWRQVFRSGYMSRIEGADVTQLEALGIDTICDFRANGERKRHPTRWHENSDTILWSRDYSFSAASFQPGVDFETVQAAQMHETMMQLYRDLPFEQAANFRELFARIAAGRLPLVFNCSAGKDRTGVAAAVLLSLLGVPRTIIETDYMLTNDSINGLITHLSSIPKYDDFVMNNQDHALPLLRAEPEYLATSFDVIERRHGSVENYLDAEIGISRNDQALIKERLLEPA